MIQAGKAYEVMDPRRRALTLEFGEDLRRWGLTVEIENTNYVPGRRGLGPIEWTAIVIGGSAGKRLLDNLVDDLYSAGKGFSAKASTPGELAAKT